LEVLHGIVNSINTVLWSYVLIVFLIGIGLWFTFRTKLVQVRMLPEMLRLLTEGVGTKTEGKQISTFQAFCVSTASRVGVGNIAGVAIAIVTGGPGAVFWMWLIAFIGCATGFVESTLAQIYKLPQQDGAFHGGPAYYIENALKQPAVAKLFAILISVTFGLIYNSVQANTIALSVETAFGVGHLTTAIVLCVLTGLVIFGGMTRIAKVAEILVPVMAVVYLLTAFIIVVLYIDQVPAMFALIFHDAFSPQAAVGGGIGTAILTGVKRGLFSNEAGEGSVPNAAATATTSHPAKQGLVQSFGVYVDTWIVCTATAFIVLLTGQYTVGGSLTGIALAQASLASTFGSLAPSGLSFVIFMFAFSSIVGNYYYGEINIAFFKGNTKQYLLVFRCLVIAMVFFGSMAELSFVWDTADLFMAFLCLTNLYAIARLGKYAFIALNDYVNQKVAGIKEPTFDPAIMPDEMGIHAWGVDDAQGK
jgi:AGCS family alanine or glycine:cation symporter